MNNINPALYQEEDALFYKCAKEFNALAVFRLMQIFSDKKAIYFCVNLLWIAYSSITVNRYSAALLRDYCYEGELWERFKAARDARKEAQNPMLASEIHGV